jgi:two-component system OmpR family sensor kinase
VPYVYARQAVPVGGARWRLIVVRREFGLSRVMLVLGRILLLGGGLLALMLLVGVLTAVRAITRPLDALRAFAERVAAASGEAGPAPPADSGLAEVDALTGAFRAMLARLEAGRERERQFASDVAHALRTPLQVISGYLTTLARRGEGDEALRRQALATLRREVAGMGALIQRLLTLSQVSVEAPLALAPVAVDALLQEILPALQDSCPEHELVLRGGAAARACGDAELLAEVLRILVENADAYASAGGTVRVETATGGDWVEVAVTNPGPPLPPEVVAHLFERFQRGGRPAASGHVGLGLAIADRLVRRMGGAWRIESSGGEVTFALRLRREAGGVA